MKKILVIIIASVLLIAAVLFLPIPQGSYDDGGPRDYNALTYKIVKWNRLVDVLDENGQAKSNRYQKTSVYWYPDNQKSIDELWKLEMSRANQKKYKVEFANDYVFKNIVQDSYYAGEEVTIELYTATDSYYVMYLNGVKQKISELNMSSTYFRFIMPNEDVFIEIESKSPEIPEAPSE